MKFYQYIDTSVNKKLIAYESVDNKIYKLDISGVDNTLDLFDDNGELLNIEEKNLKLLAQNYDEFLKLKIKLLPPVDSPETWAFGVTYMDSMKERQAESDSPDVYDKVYNSDRPESFFKATYERLVPPGGKVGIRGDSEWNVPEPELTFFVCKNKIVGFTIGNDMSSRSIEGENPLYLPQAKVYDKSASFGPAFVPIQSIDNPQKLFVQMKILRNDKEVFSGKCNTNQMKRNCDYLLSWLLRHNNILDGTAVMTGTGIIPPPEFTLNPSDKIFISIENLGTLENEVIIV
ncbi:MAG: fumarylacetoacetate hydrolase [Chloroflexi bacterium]|nr:fumarylacetoacetate hydrolase [Chloroflexota bacterium]